MAHLTKEDRLRIENMLNAGVSATEMSRNLGKSHTTISREIKKYRQEESTDRRRSRNYCIFKNECNRSRICKIPLKIFSVFYFVPSRSLRIFPGLFP